MGIGVEVGQVWLHIKSGNIYVVKCTNMRFKDTTDKWVDGILYAPMYESNWECFVRSVDDFLASFTLVK
jgi:hypothetical protein